MFDPVNEPSFRLDVAGLPEPFEVLAFTGREAISEPFVFDVDLLIDDPTLNLASLLYRPAVLHFGPEDNALHGQLHELVQRDHGPTVRLCQVRLGPRLACLSQRYSQRIFNALSVPEILSQVLREHGIAGKDLRFELSDDYPPRDFCTQYRESDFQFLQRLCAQERLHYHFEHHANGHCVVFGDGRGHFNLAASAPFQAEGRQPAVRQFQLQAGHRTVPGAEGRSDLPKLRSGCLMPLSGHPVADWNHLWLLTYVEHQGSQDPRVPYSNKIRAIHWEAPFEPPHCAVKPRMHSLQRAWVVDVDETRPDPARPVAVQFDWLYQGEGASPSYCWLPLADGLEDPDVSPLSEGTEVVVSFIGGDPDQPLICGFLPASSTVGEAGLAAPPEEVPEDGMLELLRSGEPLALLCLMPGGGSFSHCAQAACACRAMTGYGQSGAA